jgi:beta-glucosidase
MTKQEKLSFPKKFLWGVATSAHQVEGNNHNDWSVWELENAKAKAVQGDYHYDDLEGYEEISKAVKDPENYISGKATDHYHRYKEDFDLLEKMHMNAFRFSIEWSRIEPKEGKWDAKEIEHYRTYLKTLKARGIEPMMTLLHFTLPVWFAEKGGFQKRANIKYFVRYVEKVMGELGEHVRYVITINEIETIVSEAYRNGNWPPAQQSKWVAYRVLRNQIRAHNKAAKRIHNMSRRHKVSIAKNSNYVYPGDDALLSRVSAAILQYFQDDYILKRTYKTSDFIGVNYYFSNRVYGYRVHNEDAKMSDLGWDLHPDHLQYALERLHRKYKLPLIVTENGLADANDRYRKWWLMKTLLALRQAMDNDVDVQGYFHRSLTDNFEWAHGKWPHFGLAEIDYETGKRTLRPSGVWYGQVIKKIRNAK